MLRHHSYAAYGRACQQKCVLLCDRGIMDGAAYVSKEVWASVLAEKHMDTISAREGEQQGERGRRQRVLDVFH